MGMKPSPPHLKHDDMAIVNPDYWEEGVDQNAFKGWMCMTKVSVSFMFSFFVCTDLLLFVLVGSCPLHGSSFTSQMDRGGESR